MSTNLSIPEDLQVLEFASALRPLVAEGLTNDFAGFVRAAWPILHPGHRVGCRRVRRGHCHRG